MRKREHAGPSLECFCGVPLYSVVFGICAEDVDEIEVLVAVRWWRVLVCAELVASSTGDAGVKTTGLCFVVVAELGCTAVAQWVSFHISWLGWSVLWTWCERCVRNGSELAGALVLSLGAR